MKEHGLDIYKMQEAIDEFKEAKQQQIVIKKSSGSRSRENHKSKPVVFKSNDGSIKVFSSNQSIQSKGFDIPIVG